MKALIGALAAAAMLAGVEGARAQDHRDWSGSGWSDGHVRHHRNRDRPIHYPVFHGRFDDAWSFGYPAPLSYSYPADDGRYDPFVYAYMDGPGRARAPECGYWEQGRDAWTYVFVQTACAPRQTAWTYR